jgi:hypothetical protein
MRKEKRKKITGFLCWLLEHEKCSSSIRFLPHSFWQVKLAQTLCIMNIKNIYWNMQSLFDESFMNNTLETFIQESPPQNDIAISPCCFQVPRKFSCLKKNDEQLRWQKRTRGKNSKAEMSRKGREHCNAIQWSRLCKTINRPTVRYTRIRQ